MARRIVGYAHSYGGLPMSLKMATAIAACMGSLYAGPPETSPGIAVHAGACLRPADERFIQVWPRAIAKGQRVVISWFNPNGSEILLQHAPDARQARPLLLPLGVFPAKGSLELSPAGSTMYVISCVGSRVCAESISVRVLD